ncbi:hypothetical protein ILUMI_12696 [Ignelater luminosus]|uniref:Reverse transcriptase domain-containing protein n=1 Tax=Ignelater luminosus TaxID=2038154 RepID=A0A8K0CZ35_IGNLU|nr:hypothetical protein ILUMI_12696 [Ignelater luminosus]
MDFAIPLQRGNHIVTNKSWSEELTQLRQRTPPARRAYQRLNVAGDRQHLLQIYRDLKAQYKQILLDTKSKSWQRFVERHLAVNIWGVPYKIVNKISSPALPSSMERDDGTMTTDWQDSVQLLLSELLPDDNLEQDTLQQENFTEEEVRNAITTLKRKKDPGPDSIPADVIQQLNNEITPLLLSHNNNCLRQTRFPTIWKQADVVSIRKGDDKDPKKPKSYGPICLLNVLGKLSEKLVCGRFEEHREQLEKHPSQYGFRRDRSTDDAIHYACDSDAKYVLALLVDISGAFDNLWWPVLFRRLKDPRCSQQLYRIFRNYCQDRNANISSAGGRVCKRLTKGCPQGSVCGPVMWDVMMEELLQRLDASEDPAADRSLCR